MTRSDSPEKLFGAFVECSIFVFKCGVAFVVFPTILSGLALTLLSRMTTGCLMSVNVSF